MRNNQPLQKSIEIFIDQIDYRRCAKSAQNMWANSKGGFYGRGLINSKDDPHKAERVGLLGETALLLYWGFEDIGKMDNFKYKEGGDNKDIIYNDKKIEVKTAAKMPRYQSGLIRCETASGNTIQFNSDIYVFCYLKEEKKTCARVVIVGYCNKKDLETLDTVPARYGFHKNKEVKYCDLNPISEIK